MPEAHHQKCCKCGVEPATGWVRYQGRYYHVCGRCEAELQAVERQREIERRVAAVVPPLYLEARLEHLPKDLTEKMRSLPSGKGLYLWGRAGVGKTYAMCALARHKIESGEKVARVNYEQLCLDIRDTFKPGSKRTEADIIKPLCSVANLIIEDVGTLCSGGRCETDFSLRTMFTLLNERVERRLPVFVTSNKSLEELGRTFDERIESRIAQACLIVEMVGKDRRRVAGQGEPNG